MALSIIDLNEAGRLRAEILSNQNRSFAEISAIISRAQSMLSEFEAKLARLEQEKERAYHALCQCELHKNDDEDNPKSCAAEESAYQHAAARYERCLSLVNQARNVIRQFQSRAAQSRGTINGLVSRSEHAMNYINQTLQQYLCDTNSAAAGAGGVAGGPTAGSGNHDGNYGQGENHGSDGNGGHGGDGSGGHSNEGHGSEAHGGDGNDGLGAGADAGGDGVNGDQTSASSSEYNQGDMNTGFDENGNSDGRSYIPYGSLPPDAAVATSVGANATNLAWGIGGAFLAAAAAVGGAMYTIGKKVGKTAVETVDDVATAAADTAKATGKVMKDAVWARERFVKEGELYKRNFEASIKAASDEQLKAMLKEWEKIDNFSKLSGHSYSDGGFEMPQGYNQEHTPQDDKFFQIIDKANRDANRNPGNIFELNADSTINIKSALKDSVLKDSALNDKAPGFHSELYKDSQGNYILAFRGTNDFSDAGTDVTGATLREENQAKYARKLGEDLIKAGIPKDKLIVTGHSLGGRLAQEVAVTSNVKAYVYNPADLSNGTKQMLRKNKLMDRMNNIVVINSDNDMLRAIQHSPMGEVVCGKDIVRERHVISNGGSHGIGELSNQVGEFKNMIIIELNKRKLSL